MSDDIFIKHPLGPFQQPYIARSPLNNQEPVIAQQARRQPAIAQTPSTYQLRTPGTYQLPITTQNPSIRNAQNPFIRSQQEPNIRNQQEPNIRDNQTPFTYQHRSPSTYQHRNPFTYQVTYQHRATVSYQHRSPSIYRDPRSYRNPFTYQHRTPSTTQATGRNPVIYQHRSPGQYQHRSPAANNAREPSIANRQNPFIRNYQTPVIRTYQTPYNHQQPASGFLTVGRTESVARISELITAFGAGNGIPDDNNTVNGNKQGAGSILLSNYEMDNVVNDPDFGPELPAAALCGGGVTFNVAYGGTNNNDVIISIKEGAPLTGTPRMSRIGNMSSTLSSSFSYTFNNILSTSFTEICRFTNIGSGRGQVKLNFPDPTASPYNIQTGTGSGQWSDNDQNYTAEGSSVDGDQSAEHCEPITWPRTTLASPYFSSTQTDNGDDTSTSVAYHYNLDPDNESNTITTSYQSINTTNGNGFSIGIVKGAAAQENAGSAENLLGDSTIVEIIVNDLDGTEHKCDLLIVFAISAEANSEQGDPGGE